MHIYIYVHTCTLKDLNTDRMLSVRGDVIRGIISDSQREFPYSYCHSSDQTQSDKDASTDTKREKETCSHIKRKKSQANLPPGLQAKHKAHTDSLCLYTQNANANLTLKYSQKQKQCGLLFTNRGFSPTNSS